MSWGSKQSTESTQTSTNTPIQQEYAKQLQSSLAPHYGALIQEADKPVYGDAQKAGVLNNLNDLANASIKHLSSTLAGRGQLDSGQFTAGANGIEQQRYGAASQFFNQLPAMEAQSHLARMTGALNTANAYSASVPMGETSNGTSSSLQTTSPGMAQLIAAIGGIALGAATGGAMGGGAGASAMQPGPLQPTYGGGGGGYYGGGGGYMVPYQNYSPSMQGGGPESPFFDPSAFKGYGNT